MLTVFHHLTLLAGLPKIPVWDQYSQFLRWCLRGMADELHSAGLAVIAFTIIIKLLLMPLTITSIKSSKSMQELQPKIKELQKKHGKDRQKLSQETMKLYSQYHVNPMAGCLPMIIQIPIFYGLYHAIRTLSSSHVDYWSNSFLWLHSLAQSDQYHILPIAAGVFQFVQTKMMKPQGQPKSTDPQQAMMNSLMNFMPLMVVVFGWGFASGPVVYWVTQSIFSVVQQWFITGWGSMKDWIPALPELPEHRRLGYRPPRNLDDVVVVSGDEPQKTGVMGWLNKRVQEAQASANRVKEEAATTKTVEAAASTGPKTVRPVKKTSPASRAAASKAANANKDSPDASDEESPRYASETRSSNGATTPAVPRRSRPKRDQTSTAE